MNSGLDEKGLQVAQIDVFLSSRKVLKNLTKVYKIQVFRASLILCLVTEQCSGLMGEIKNWNKDEINFLN